VKQHFDWREDLGPPGPIPWLCPCPRPQKTPWQKKSGQLCRNYASNRKDPDYYWLSSQVLLHSKLGSYDLKFGFVQN